MQHVLGPQPLSWTPLQPCTGKLLAAINDRVAAAGEEGLVRVWQLGEQSQTLEASM
jgi:hypothetical protein